MSKRYPGGIIRKTPQTPSQTSAQGIWDMASVTQAVKENTWPIAGVPDPISRSLRFRSSASAYLNRTPTSAGNRKTWTFSAWIKRGTLGSTAQILHCYDGSSSRRSSIQFNSDNTIGWDQGGSSTSGLIDTVAVYRDPSAWYHLVCVANYSNGTAANRALIYVNGVLQAVTTADDFDNDDGLINSTNAHQIGSQGGSGNFFDGYMTEVYLIDGQALTPSSFGSTNDQTGVWQPIAYTGTYGTNGFYLPFSNTASTSTLGNDFSGNSNNWTTNNISLTSGSTYDSMTDVPTQWIPYNTAGDTGALWRGNYGTLNPLYKGSLQTISNGNLTSSKSSGTNISDVWGNFGMTSGKWYFECSVAALSATVYIGIGQGGGTGEPTDDLAVSPASYFYGSADGNKFYGSTGTAYGNTYTTGDVIGCAIDMDNGKIWWSKNGTWQASGDPAAGTNAAFTDLLTRGSNAFLAFSSTNGASNSNTLNWNFGQRPFSYTPPSGFKTLNTTNLPTPTIGTTSTTQANDYFNAVLYTGNGADNRTISGLDFTPGLVWMKDRSNAYSHILIDAVRGNGKYLRSNGTNEENWDGNIFPNSGPTTNGFIVDGVSNVSINANGDAYVAWTWRAAGSGVTNTAGSITSTVSANTSSGFSIVTYTGNGANSTVGHGLGTALSMLIIKRRNSTGNWPVWHTSLPSAQRLLFLELTFWADTDYPTFLNSTAPTSSVFSVGTNSSTNASGGTYVAYCFAQVAGYSAFGSYTGNGSSDGPFIFTGFRPRYVLVKKSSGESNWQVLDSSRSPYNLAGEDLLPNASDAEKTIAQGFNQVDMLSNGFKIRNTNCNDSGGTYIYACFAEFPFKFSLAR